LAKISVPKGVIKDIVIVGVGVLAIWFGLQLASGTENPFYVVASGSMIPVLEVYDVLLVQGHTPFEDIEIGDIIVFDRPSDHNRVIVHRVVSITDDDPKTLRTKGDANPASIPGTDFPITKEEYIGKVEYIAPQIGYVTQFLKPPINYIIIVVVIGIMIVKQITKKKKEKENKFSESLDSDNQDTNKELSDIDKIEKDSEYSEHIEKSDTSEDKKIDSDELTKTDEKDKEE
jgi:signal peptidase